MSVDRIDHWLAVINNKQATGMLIEHFFTTPSTTKAKKICVGKKKSRYVTHELDHECDVVFINIMNNIVTFEL